MFETFEEHCRKHLEDTTARLSRLLKLNAPGVIVSQVVLMLVQDALGAYGKDFSAELLKRLVSKLRQETGFCQRCDNQIPTDRTHPPFCEHCDAEQEESHRRLLRDHPELGE